MTFNWPPHKHFFPVIYNIKKLVILTFVSITCNGRQKTAVSVWLRLFIDSYERCRLAPTSVVIELQVHRYSLDDSKKTRKKKNGELSRAVCTKNMLFQNYYFNSTIIIYIKWIFRNREMHKTSSHTKQTTTVHFI